MSTTRRTDFQKARTPAKDAAPRQPPVDHNAELGVLGSILLKAEVCDEVVPIVRAEDFHDEAHQKLFDHMVTMYNDGKKIDPTLLVDRLKSAGHYELVGGTKYLARILEAVHSAAHAKYYADVVREKSTYRSLIDALTGILRDAYEQSTEAHDLLSSAEQRIFSILDRRGTAEVFKLKDILHDALDKIETRRSGDRTGEGVETLFAEFDALTGGLHGSELIVLAARPSMGKTALAMNIAENVAIGLRQPVLFVSLEMSRTELADRLLCSAARVNGHRLRNGTLSREDEQRLMDKASEISESPLFVDDSPTRTVIEIAAAARRVRRICQNRLALIVIDYLQLIEPDNPRDPRQEQVARITRRLKGIARELNVPVLCLAQLNRQAEDSKDHRPRLSHLRESGAIEQDADVVMFVHREEYYLRGEDQKELAGQAEIIIAKQRNGPVGDVELIWHKDYTRFEDKAPERLQALDDFNRGPASDEF
ncbi:MAG: replicative DNA helicase [Planctomycetes bacterium]|nr:replicative DNA helicase [Planctomycetota bacterium]